MITYLDWPHAWIEWTPCILLIFVRAQGSLVSCSTVVLHGWCEIREIFVAQILLRLSNEFMEYEYESYEYEHACKYENEPLFANLIIIWIWIMSYGWETQFVAPPGSFSISCWEQTYRYLRHPRLPAVLVQLAVLQPVRTTSITVTRLENPSSNDNPITKLQATQCGKVAATSPKMRRILAL